MSQRDGGPAFPSPLVRNEDGERFFADDYGYGGMTLRDYFAGQALQGMLASNIQVPVGSAPQTNIILLASACYRAADAMLAAREKQP
jgi:hypothetical protein